MLFANVDNWEGERVRTLSCCRKRTVEEWAWKPRLSKLTAPSSQPIMSFPWPLELQAIPPCTSLPASPWRTRTSSIDTSRIRSRTPKINRNRTCMNSQCGFWRFRHRQGRSLSTVLARECFWGWSIDGSAMNSVSSSRNEMRPLSFHGNSFPGCIFGGSPTHRFCRFQMGPHRFGTTCWSARTGPTSLGLPRAEIVGPWDYLLVPIRP